MGKPSLKIKLKSPTWQSNSNGFEHCLENSWSSKMLGARHLTLSPSKIVCNDIKKQWKQKVEILIPTQGRGISELPRDSARKLKVIGCVDTRNPNDTR